MSDQRSLAALGMTESSSSTDSVRTHAELLLRAALAQGAQAQPERVQLDEAFGVALIVGTLVFLEGDVLHGIERLGRLAADHRGVALVELQPHRAGHVLLAAVD